MQKAMAAGFTTLGGHHIRFNIVDTAKLKKAQQCLADFKSLIVRVAGYSAFFNQLTRDVHDEIIQRTEQQFAQKINRTKRCAGDETR